MHVTAIIAAAGSGRRVGSATPKQMLDLGGRTMLSHSINAFQAHPRISELIVVVPPGQGSLFSSQLQGMPLRPVRLVIGGARRQDSVANAFDQVDPATDIVLIHDAARPFVSASLIEKTIDAAAKYGAAITAVQARDTVKRVAREPGRNVVTDTIPRDTVYLAQTPQGFRREVLAAAVAVGRSGVEATDEAALAERAGYQVHVVDGDPGNVKITTEEDLEAARLRLTVPSGPGRVGTGYDLHRLVEGRPLIIGGVTIPFELGALGHSDADVACHAATDAILGAASLGDIGRHFPDTDPKWKGADSLVLLREAARLVREQGYEIGNVDITVILERPKIKDVVDEMRARLAGAMGIDPACVSLKGKTNEGVDAVGRGEAIAAHAISLLRQVAAGSRPPASDLRPPL